MTQLVNEPWFKDELNKLAVRAFQDLEKNEEVKKSTSKFMQDVFSDPNLQKKAGDGIRGATLSGLFGWTPKGYNPNASKPAGNAPAARKQDATTAAKGATA